jgi:hypothetical protein
MVAAPASAHVAVTMPAFNQNRVAIRLDDGSGRSERHGHRRQCWQDGKGARRCASQNEAFHLNVSLCARCCGKGQVAVAHSVPLRAANWDKLIEGDPDPFFFSPYDMARLAELVDLDQQCEFRRNAEGLATSSTAPVFDKLRTRQSMPPPLNAMVPAFKTRCRNAIRCSSMAKTYASDFTNQ